MLADMNADTEMKAKGLPKKMFEKTFGWGDYENAIYLDVVRTLEYRMMRSRRHVNEHLDTCKIGVTSNNDKVFMNGPHNYRCLGHYRNYLPAAAEEDGVELWKLPV